MTNIEFNTIGLRIGQVPILKDISFSLKNGEIVGILGPSGCGKTSFFNILSGLIPQTEGSILKDGVVVADRAHLCSYMFQDDLLFPWRNIYDNVLLGTEAVKPDALESRKADATRLLRLFGLKDFSKKYPHQLSGGMRRRAAFVRTLLNDDRELFLFDEPTAGLDHLLRLQVEDTLFHFLMENQRTSLVITHDVETAVALVDRVFIFAPRPAHIAAEVQIGLARKYGSPTAARTSSEFGDTFQFVLNSYMKHGTAETLPNVVD